MTTLFIYTCYLTGLYICIFGESLFQKVFNYISLKSRATYPTLVIVVFLVYNLFSFPDGHSLCCLQVPTLHVVGEKDKRIGPDAMENLKKLPNSHVFVISGAGHAAYMDQTHTWHKAIYNFLNSL